MDSESDYLVIGKVIKPFGVRGETKVLPITDDVGRFRDVGHVFLRDGSGYRRNIIEQVKISGNYVILKLATVGSRDDFSYSSIFSSTILFPTFELNFFETSVRFPILLT